MPRMIIAALNMVLLGTKTANASGCNLQSKLAALNHATTQYVYMTLEKCDLLLHTLFKLNVNMLIELKCDKFEPLKV